MKNLFNILDRQIFFTEFSSEEKVFQQNSEKIVSVTLFIAGVLSETLSSALIHNFSGSSWSISFLIRLGGYVIVIMLYLMWVTFFSAILKKHSEVYKLLFFIFSNFSPFILLLPVTIIAIYFDLVSMVYLIEIFIILSVINRILKHTKLCYSLTDTQIGLIVSLPIAILMLIIFLPIIFFLLTLYGKI